LLPNPESLRGRNQGRQQSFFRGADDDSNTIQAPLKPADSRENLNLRKDTNTAKPNSPKMMEGTPPTPLHRARVLINQRMNLCDSGFIRIFHKIDSRADAQRGSNGDSDTTR
jgi:hypothetical protein